MGDFRKKNILQTDSRGKNLARKYMALHVGEKHSITRGLEEINFLHKPNNQYLSFPLQKSNGWPVSNET